MIPSSNLQVIGGLILPENLPDLAEQYYNYALTTRGVSEETAKAERPYLKRFFDYFGPPDSSAEFFEKVCPETVTDCLVKYAAVWNAGSRCGMQKTVRLFLRFAYLVGYLQTDLSALSPSVRSPRMGKITRAISSEDIDRLVSSIGTGKPGDYRDVAIICLLSTYGVRSVQIRRLRLEDVDWVHSRIHFCAVKGGRPIKQHLTAKAGNRLIDYITKGRPAYLARKSF
ncbi:MAG: hypothetical protein EOM20_08015 [Spartobacteria bacterium]|nr:hypothetical protein [Spartobacteria bacterium]